MIEGILPGSQKKNIHIPRTGRAGLTIPAKTFERNSWNSEKIRRAARERKKRTDSSKVRRGLKKRFSKKIAVPPTSEKKERIPRR